MGKKRRTEDDLPDELKISAEEEVYRLIFDFAYWLENQPGKKGVDGALILLRMFLAERKDG